jgi:hypothetical protein
MKLSRSAIAFYFALVFASGAILGVFGQRLYTATTVNANATKNPQEFRKRVIAEMQSRLKLDDKQVVRLNAIMDETRAQFEETRQKNRPTYDAIQEEQTRKVRSMLTPNQLGEYEKMHRQREERRKQTGSYTTGPGI